MSPPTILHLTLVTIALGLGSLPMGILVESHWIAANILVEYLDP